MKTGKPFYYGKFVVLGIAAMIAFTFVVMWLWNWLVPEVFNGPDLTYWQTLGLLVLSKILFSGIGGGSSSRSSRHSRSHSWKKGDTWKRKFDEKMNGMAGDKTKDGATDGATDGEVIVTE